jgi:hypothetical protein
MKSLMSLMTVGCLLAVGAAAMAADKPFSGFKYRGDSGSPIRATLGASESTSDVSYQGAPPPAPADEAKLVPPQPVPEGASHSMVGSAPMPAAQGAPVELFSCVKYRHEHEKHPCPVEMIVSIKDPCACDDPCDCCAAPKCVHVLVCAPPCGCPEIKCNKEGSRVKYDYGKYGFEVTSRKGVVTVTYDD